MNRLIAAVIDFYLPGFIISITAMIFRVMGYLTFNELLFSVVIGVYVYYFIFDYFYDGMTVGKRCMKVKVIFGKEDKITKMRFSLFHPLCLVLVYATWPIGLLITLILKFKMPYDKFFNVRIE